MSTITGPSQRVQSRVSHTGFVVIMWASMVVRIDEFHTANFSVRHQGNPVRRSTLPSEGLGPRPDEQGLGHGGKWPTVYSNDLSIGTESREGVRIGDQRSTALRRARASAQEVVSPRLCRWDRDRGRPCC